MMKTSYDVRKQSWKYYQMKKMSYKNKLSISLYHISFQFVKMRSSAYGKRQEGNIKMSTAIISQWEDYR